MPPTLPTPPATLDDFKKRFSRDFKYGKGLDTVRDEDIANAMTDAMTVMPLDSNSLSKVLMLMVLVAALRDLRRPAP